MSAMELEVQKADLARAILTATDENMINSMWTFLKNYNLVTRQQKTSQKRQIGFLKGKAKVVFHDDWSMTPEELGMV